MSATGALLESERSLDDLVEAKTEAEGLTPAILQEVLDYLGGREECLLAAVFQALATGYRSTGQSDPRLDKAAVLLGAGAPAGRKEELQMARLAGQHRDVCGRMQPAREAAEALTAAAGLEDRLRHLDDLLASGRDVDAARCIADAAASNADPLPSAAGLEAELLDALAERANGISERASQEVERSIACRIADDGTWTLTVATPRSSLQASWENLRLLCDSPAAVGRVSRKLLEGPFTLFKAEAGAVSTSGRHDESGAAVLDVRPAPGVALETGVASMMEAFEFVANHVFLDRKPLLRQCGRVLWPPIAAALVSRRLGAAAPQSDGELDAFEAACRPAAELEASLAALGYLDPTGAPEPVAAFVAATCESWVQRVRLRLVLEARELIIHADHEAVAAGLPLPLPGPAASGESSDGIWGPEGEEASLLAEGVHRISRTGEAIVALMRHGLAHAEASGSRAVSRATLAALGDVAALYAALPPALRAREMEVPQLAALYRNDCFHIAQQLFTLPHCYPRLRWPEDTAEAGLVRDALRLRDSGAACLSELVLRHSTEIIELLMGSGGFERVHKAQRGIKARKAVQQALHQISRLGGVLRPVLPLGAFAAAGISVIDAAAEKATDDVLLLRDISVEESEDLPRVLDPLASEAAAAYVGAGLSGEAAETRALVVAVESGSRALHRLKEVIEILSARLADIQQRWRSGRLARLGFSSGHVERLVTALFEDTELRQAVLRDVRLAPAEGE